MKTKLFKDETAEAAQIIRGGGLVAVPTETVYGLAGNGLDPEAVEKIYLVKGRPPLKPLSLMVSGPEDMDRFGEEVPAAAKKLAERFWPGPLTIVLNAKNTVPSIVRAGGGTVGLRCPAQAQTLALIRAAGVPLAAPSANPSGAPSPRSAQEVLGYFDGRIDAVLDGGSCTLGTESTLFSVAERPYRILRQGALPADQIADVLVEDVGIVGITGGSGSGKTTALRVLEGLGALVIDADAVYHELLQSSAELLSDISGRFPGTVGECGLDRKALAAAVFSEPAALADLNRITHPFVTAEVMKRLRAFALSGGRLAAIDAIELLSSPLAALCTRTYAVLADPSHRIERIMKRDGIDRVRAEMRLKAQRPDSYFVSQCSGVLYNDSDEASFASLCQKTFMEDLQAWMS